jgi:hypothetical protein
MVAASEGTMRYFTQLDGPLLASKISEDTVGVKIAPHSEREA